MKGKRAWGFFFLMLAVSAAGNLSVKAAPSGAVIEETLEENKEETKYILSVRESYEGEKEPALTYEYNGRIYDLQNAEIEHIYGKRKTGETAEFTELVELPENDVTLIPKEKTDGDMVYVLDESSLELQIVAYGESPGTRLKEYTVEIPELPDNDMKRLEVEIQKDGIDYVLVDVTYTVTEKDENGIPTEYKALCKYEGAEGYTVPIPIRWQTPARYVGAVMEKYVEETVITATYLYTEEKELIPAEEIKEEPPGHGIQLAAIAAGGAGGLLIAALGYIVFFTAPIYAAVFTGGYKYIGRIRLKKKKEAYVAVLTERLIEKAEITDFKVKIPKSVARNSRMEALEISCPDGGRIFRKLEPEVTFTVKE